MPLSEKEISELNILNTGINKKWGAGSIRILGGNEVVSIPRTSTGIPSLDIATGGGYPRGRVIELFGPESSGKTTITLSAIAEAQANGQVCAFIDVEHALDVQYARALGVDTDALLISQPDTAEEALDIAEILINSGIVSMIVIDSVAALVPKAELEGEISDSSMGVVARMMGKHLRKVVGATSRNNVTLFFINQIRMKIGVMFGNPETTTGGNALKFAASIRMDIRKKKTLTQGDESVANETEVKIIKNKVAPPFKVAKLVIRFGHGVDKTLDLVRVGVEHGLVKKSGSWYDYDGERLAQGEASAAAALEADPVKRKKLYSEITSNLFPKIMNPTEIPEEPNE